MSGLVVTVIAVALGLAAATHTPAGAHAPAAAGGPAAADGPTAAPSREAVPRNGPPANVRSLGAGWTTALNATFTGSGLDTSLWGTCYPWALPSGCTNFGNDEYEWYTPAQIQVSGGALHLTARRTPVQGRAKDGGANTYAYASGMVTTFPGFRYQYGYTEVVARIPYGPGLWPALWLAAASEKWPPEIDILEHWGTTGEYAEHLHSADTSVQAATESAANLSAGWHTFGLYWSASRVIWYVDGHQVMSAVRGVPQEAMYFIANLAVYQRSAPGWKDGSALDIRSVTVWQAASYR